MRRKYTGYIFNGDNDCETYGLPEKATFICNGFWVGYRGEKVGSWVICDKDGNEDDQYSRFQFSRNRAGTFFLETVD